MKLSGVICLRAFAIASLLLAWSCNVGPALADEAFGPPNLLKLTPTPFGAGNGEEPEGDGEEEDVNKPRPLARALATRMVSTRVYLPGRMVLGKPAEFVVKGKPGSTVAIAMAESNTGARPVAGRTIRLGSDRKVMTLGTISEMGVVSLWIETPIQGDLIGQHLYFETAVWSRPDFSDLEIAVPVKSEVGDDTSPDFINGVVVSPDVEAKRGIRIVPDAKPPLTQRSTIQTLDSGRP